MSAATGKSNDLSYIDAAVIVLIENAKRWPKIEKAAKYLLFIFMKSGPKACLMISKICLMHRTKRMELESHSLMPYVWTIGSITNVS